MLLGLEGFYLFTSKRAFKIFVRKLYTQNYLYNHDCFIEVRCVNLILNTTHCLFMGCTRMYRLLGHRNQY